MALKPKTFRTSEDVIAALKAKTEELELSESDLINRALRCFLGLSAQTECETYANQIEILTKRLDKLVQANNLKEV